MKKFTILFALVIALFSNGHSQIVCPSTVASYYVDDLFQGNYVAISNINSSGISSMTGTPSNLGKFFSLGQYNFPIDMGIILSTGNIFNVYGPNQSASTTHNFNIPGDSLLGSTIGSVNTYDAAFIEFDYVPYTNVISFEYVFGSEEYPEFVNSSFNDVFGFFVSGPNPYGGNYTNQNIAIVPGTTNTPVAINNVNNGSSGAGPCTNCAYYVDNTGGLGVIFDGYTTSLPVYVEMIPFATYHIKIVVADVADAAYDSGVFLKQNSFSCLPLTYNFQANGTKAYSNTVKEDSTSLLIEILLPDTARTPISYHFSISGTADNGSDYQLLTDSITFLPGTINQSIQIIPLSDTLTEGDETITLVFNYLKDTLNITLEDNPPAQNPSSIIENDLSIHISIYPNPANEILNIETNTVFNSLEIIDIEGRIVLTTMFKDHIDISKLPAGNYFLTLKGNTGKTTRKFSKL
ncbi:MAG: choice-of-anchor L domain-containing protein [Bacteroidales bacterium]|nr:choice-of-anchor L domain-containing protein [Bacteroidales bacterium]